MAAGLCSVDSDTDTDIKFYLTYFYEIKILNDIYKFGVL